MNCFKHPHNSALGICRVCGKGLCPECVVDLGHSLACQGAHEADAVALKALTLRSTKLLKASRTSRFLAPVFIAIFGLVFLWDGFKQESLFNFTSFLGAAFVAFGVAILASNLRAYGGKLPGDS